MLQRIIKFCEDQRMFERGDRVAVGFSGGADSVLLACVLQEMAVHWDLTLALVHVNHGIRGEEAERDEQFCLEFGRQRDIPVEVYHGNVPKLAAERGVSEEEAGRDYRYGCLESYCAEHGFQKIAVAHHQNDQAETVLFHVIRGSGLRGMGGMRPVRGNVVRPLLAVSREEIVRELTERGQAWCEDSTNAENEHSRNRIRNDILPLLQEEITPAAVRHLAEMAGQMQELYDYVSEHAEGYASAQVRQYSEQNRQETDCTAFLELPEVVRREIALRMMEQCAGSRKDITRKHLEGFCRLAESETGKRLDLPYGMTAGQDYGLLWVAKGTGGADRSAERERLQQEFPVLLEELAQGQQQAVCLEDFSGGSRRFLLQVMPFTKILEENSGKLPKNHCTKCFDYDRICSMLAFRHPQEGDYFYLDSAGKRKKLSRFLIDQHVLRERRQEIWLLAMGHHVIWIPAFDRVSAGVYVTKDTKVVLCVQEGKREK